MKLGEITRQKMPKKPKISKNKSEVSGDDNSANLDNLFSSEVGESDTKIVKELITGNKDIEQKTELSANQISVVARLYFLSDYIGEENLKNLLDKFLVLQISKDRKSRKEFVDTFKGINEGKNGSGFMSKMGDMFKGV